MSNWFAKLFGNPNRREDEAAKAEKARRVAEEQEKAMRKAAEKSHKEWQKTKEKNLPKDD